VRQRRRPRRDAVNLGIQQALLPADVASYGWRIAFLLGGFIGCVSYLLRRSLEESPEFLRVHSVASNPISELLREHGKAVLTAAAGYNTEASKHEVGYSPGRCADSSWAARRGGALPARFRPPQQQLPPPGGGVHDGGSGGVAGSGPGRWI
jgi:hypothetical protein